MGDLRFFYRGPPLVQSYTKKMKVIGLDLATRAGQLNTLKSLQNIVKTLGLKALIHRRLWQRHRYNYKLIFSV